MSNVDINTFGEDIYNPFNLGNCTPWKKGSFFFFENHIQKEKIKRILRVAGELQTCEREN
jgi:hypothetical protein